MRVALAAGGVRGQDRAQVRVTAHVCDGGRRPRIWAPESQNHGEKPAPPAGALQRGDGPGRVVCRRLLLVVAFVLDPSSLSSPGGNQPVLAVSSRITRCCGPAPSGLTPPGRAGWQSPPTATRDPGPPHLWEEVPRLVHDTSPPRVRALGSGGGCNTHVLTGLIWCRGLGL